MPRDNREPTVEYDFITETVITRIPRQVPCSSIVFTWYDSNLQKWALRTKLADLTEGSNVKDISSIEKIAEHVYILTNTQAPYITLTSSTDINRLVQYLRDKYPKGKVHVSLSISTSEAKINTVIVELCCNIVKTFYIQKVELI